MPVHIARLKSEYGNFLEWPMSLPNKFCIAVDQKKLKVPVLVSEKTESFSPFKLLVVFDGGCCWKCFKNTKPDKVRNCSVFSSTSWMGFFLLLCNTCFIVGALECKNGLRFIHVLFNNTAARTFINFVPVFRLHIFPDSPEK